MKQFEWRGAGIQRSSRERSFNPHSTTLGPHPQYWVGGETASGGSGGSAWGKVDTADEVMATQNGKIEWERGFDPPKPDARSVLLALKGRC
jgi:hypothetical protein